MDFVDKKEIGRRLKSIREDNRSVQEEVKQGLGMSQGGVSGMENGATFPSARALAWYARRYNVSVDYFLGLIDEPLPLERKKAAPLDAGQLLGGFGISHSFLGESSESQQEFEKYLEGLIERVLLRREQQ